MLMLQRQFYKNLLRMFTAYYGFLLTTVVEILTRSSSCLSHTSFTPSLRHNLHSTVTLPVHNFVVLHADSRAGHNISGKDHRVHCSININTETGRLSARRPNLQVIMCSSRSLKTSVLILKSYAILKDAILKDHT
ncbi:DNA polymerase I B, chloroplastic/mitochondrial [Glycine max]|nr:DNA polymerase I B, chloroplastic/mitochondrial [Glycine max]